jgi:exonuclease SbcC
MQNWQNHQEKVVEFDPQVTVIVGDNDSGKSAILRALRWIAFDEWDGIANEHITWGEDSSECILSLDGHEITRYKSVDGKNLYFLDEKRFAAFYPDVPQPIKKLLNCGPDNFQNQDDPPFWLSLTSGQAASALNEIFHLEDIDAALDSARSEVRKIGSRVQVMKENVVQFQEEVRKLKWVDKADKALKQIETLERLVHTQEENITSRTLQIQEVEEAEGKMWTLKRRIKLGEKALLRGERLAQLNLQIANLERVIQLENELCQRAKSLCLKQEKLRKWLAETCPLCGRTGKQLASSWLTCTSPRCPRCPAV